MRVTRAHAFLHSSVSSDTSHTHEISQASRRYQRARGGTFTLKLSLSLSLVITLTALTGDETRHPRPGQAPRSATAIAFAVPCPVPGQRGHAPVNSTRATRSKLRHRPSLSSSLPTSHLRCPLRWSSLHSTSPFRPVSSHVAWLGTIRETRRQTALSSSIVAGALFRTARARATKYSRTRARASALVRPNKLFHR